MKYFKIKCFAICSTMLGMGACHEELNEFSENTTFTELTDYTQSSNMILPLYGVYERFAGKRPGWAVPMIIGVRGDDVNAGGDQVPLQVVDEFDYSSASIDWMPNDAWSTTYGKMVDYHSAMDEIEKFQEEGANEELAEQYKAEVRVLKSWELYHLSNVFGGLIIPNSSLASDLLTTEYTSREGVLEYISNEMDAVNPFLLDMRPNQRTDLPGGVTRYTALAMKALVNLSLENYQAVADATSEIITKGGFSLEPDFYQLFKNNKGKLNDENLLEKQYSYFGAATGTSVIAIPEAYGTNVTPAVSGLASGWGFWEPSKTFVKFMLERNDEIRLSTSVLFSPSGIIDLSSEGVSLPSWVSNVTPDGDIINDNPRLLFASGKHYLPSSQMTSGRTAWGGDKNTICIRYAEILLMHTEALVRGATGTGMTADEAFNEVRTRAGMSNLTGVTLNDVMDERFAELAMEWGRRFEDLVRTKDYEALSYEGRLFTEDHVFLPYPQAQIDMFEVLRDK